MVTISARTLGLTSPTPSGPNHALSDTNLEISLGEFGSSIGHSGYGKTTFLRCVAAFEAPTFGPLTVNGLISAEVRRACAYDTRSRAHHENHRSNEESPPHAPAATPRHPPKPSACA